MSILKTASRWKCDITFAILPAVPALVGWDSSVCIPTRYGLHGPGIESRWGVWDQSSLLYDWYQVFPGCKAAGVWR